MANKDRLRLWADALDSGEYEQCRESLTIVDRETGEKSHCCLGVITEIAIAADPEVLGFKGAVKETHHESSPERECDYLNYVFDSGTEASWLPQPVRNWLELPNGNVPLTDPETGTIKYAWEWNDESRKTFPEIAAMIRHTFEL